MVLYADTRVPRNFMEFCHLNVLCAEGNNAITPMIRCVAIIQAQAWNTLVHLTMDFFPYARRNEVLSN